MMACPAATTARIGCLWRSEGIAGVLPGSASPRRSRPARDTRARASELQQAPRPQAATAVPAHKVTVHDRQRGVVHEFVVPEDQYILHTAEAQDIRLPFACRHDGRSHLSLPCSTHLGTNEALIIIGEAGCCTSCAVRIKSGQIRQPEALGISAELKDQGYALLCVGFPSGDVEVETQDEDEASTKYIGSNSGDILHEGLWLLEQANANEMFALAVFRAVMPAGCGRWLGLGSSLRRA
ncbi:ferredoxin-1 [Panicum miliaceum]|uniref:Ferredoxin-1 n=1 Tax=Panicum miliaceum TaxID=4540 RepID=A0A3L6S4M6_PANMI|nr:ferredoxin-1 [Panicum miliaceum]